MANNRRINDNGGGKVKVEKTNEAALETTNARIEQIGAFRVAALAASQAAVAETYQTVEASAGTSFVAGRGGDVMGMAWGLSTAVTAGTLTAQVTVGGTAAGDAVNLAGATSGETEQSVPVAFNKGDKLGVKHTTNSGFTPTPNLATWLLIRWTPVSIEG